MRSVVVLPVESDSHIVLYNSICHATWRLPTRTVHPRAHSDTNFCTHIASDKRTHGRSVGETNARPNGVANESANVPPNRITHISTNKSAHGAHSSTLCGANTPSHRVANPSSNHNTHTRADCRADTGANRSANQRAIDCFSNVVCLFVIFVFILILGLHALRCHSIGGSGDGFGCSERGHVATVAPREAQD
jgi:hypothetical protein